jgi:RNA polymerase sigma-70 factor, ECF subfamily
VAVSRRSSPARGDTFTAFFVAHERRIRAFALRRTESAARADELVADVMTVAWKRFEKIDPELAYGWLCGVAIRLEANHRRSQRRRYRAIDMVIAEAESRRLVSYFDAGGVEPEEREALLAAWNGLDDDDRELLRLVAWEGLSNDEVAAAFDIGPAAARKRLSRARARLVEGYAAAVEEPTGGAR